MSFITGLDQLFIHFAQIARKIQVIISYESRDYTRTSTK